MISPAEAAALLRGAAERMPVRLAEVVEVTMERALVVAKERIGTERPEWPPLAPATYDRGTIGPLLRTGAMRDGLYVEHDGLRGVLKSGEDYIRFSEFGTSHEPPRPLLKGAVEEAYRVTALPEMRTLARTIMR